MNSGRQPDLSYSEFEALYIRLRSREGRLYSDKTVARLPDIDRSHVHYREWKLRKRSSDRLIHYLENKEKPLSILDAGCGNGWLSGRLAGMNQSLVTGADINLTELEQAKRVFSHRRNLQFMEGDIANMKFHNKFDIIVLAACIQYFRCLKAVINPALSLLTEGGEIHILDSHFYPSEELENARQRSLSYYCRKGCEEMASRYFHHSYESLKEFNHRLLFDPAAIKNKLFRRKQLFPWICISAS